MKKLFVVAGFMLAAIGCWGEAQAKNGSLKMEIKQPVLAGLSQYDLEGLVASRGRWALLNKAAADWGVKLSADNLAMPKNERLEAMAVLAKIQLGMAIPYRKGRTNGIRMTVTLQWPQILRDNPKDIEGAREAVKRIAGDLPFALNKSKAGKLAKAHRSLGALEKKLRAKKTDKNSRKKAEEAYRKLAGYLMAVEWESKVDGFWQGNAYGNSGKAVDYMIRSLMADKSNVWGHAKKARALVQQGRFEMAMRDLNSAVSKVPRNPFFYNERGLVQQKLDKPDKAMADFNKALEKSPGYAPAHYNRARLLKAREDWKMALDAVNRAIAANSSNAAYYSLRGDIHLSLGFPAEALKDYDQAISIDDMDPSRYYRRGVVLFRLAEDPALAQVTAGQPAKKATELEAVSDKNTHQLNSGKTEHRKKACTDWHKAAQLGHKKAGEMAQANCGG